jgi:ATP-dependent DNA helicase RecG
VYLWGAEVSQAPVSSANISAIRSFIKKGKEAGRITFSFDSVRNVLNKLHLIKGNKLLNAGQVLFCKNNGIEVQAAVFAGRDKITFLDIQSFRGNLFELIEKSETYVKEHINWRADLSGSRRIEIPEVPVRAIKEAIINSLCHRDFTNPKSNEIAVYKDRIEIYNPGQFPYDHEPDEFIAGKGKSIPRNPLIGDAFYLTKDIERWGSGLKRISEECKKAGVRVAFERMTSGFQVKFYRPGIMPASAQAQKGEGVSEGVSEGVISLFEYIGNNPGQRVPAISQALNIPSKTLERWLKKLKNEGKIRYEGSAKSGGYWAAVKKISLL